MSVAGPRLFDFAGAANFLGVSRFRVSSQKTQPLVLKNPRSFDFAGVANFLGVSRFRVSSQKTQPLVLKKKSRKNLNLQKQWLPPAKISQLYLPLHT
jgi:hypothetical protein